jgi:hypothetical protein
MIKIIFPLILIFNAGVLSGKNSSAFGIPYSSEAYFTFLVLFTAYYFYYHIVNNKRVIIYDLVVVSMVIAAWIISALLSALHFGQPLVFGLIEERRIFEVLVYFPMVFYLKEGRISTNYLLKTLFWVGVFSGIALLILYLQKYGFKGGGGGEKFREDRMSLGSSAIVMTLSVSIAILLSKESPILKVSLSKRALILAISFCLFLFVVIIQNRQILIGLGVISILLMIRHNQKMFLSFTALCCFGLFFLDMAHFFELFKTIFSEQYISESARSRTISIIYKELYLNGFVGMGALSGLWNEGFSNLYHEYFFLSDVGISGTLYRYGYLAPFFIFTPIYIMYKNIRKIEDPSLNMFLNLLFWFMVLLLPLGSLIENRGDMTGLIMGVAVGASMNSMKQRQLRLFSPLGESKCVY